MTSQSRSSQARASGVVWSRISALTAAPERITCRSAKRSPDSMSGVHNWLMRNEVLSSSVSHSKKNVGNLTEARKRYRQ